MSEDERDAVAGRALRELRDAEDQLACYLARAKQIASDLVKAAEEMKRATELGGGDAGSVRQPNYDTAEEAGAVLNGIRKQSQVAEEKRRILNDLFPNRHGSKPHF